MARVRYDQRQIRGGDRGPRSLDTDALHRIARIAQPSRIDDVQRNTPYLDAASYGVACRAWHVGDDCGVFPHEAIHETGFAYVRPADEHDMQAFAQKAPLPRTSADARNAVAQ